jgi:hypothetical protein
MAGGRGVHFAWTPVAGAAGYRLELSGRRKFGDATLSFEVDRSRFVLKEELDESIYYWRVRALRSEGVEGPVSEVTGFRLIVKPLPDAPQLFDPEFKIGDE